MGAVVVKMPMRRLDMETRQERMEYAEYSGLEGDVAAVERQRYRTARIFHLENRRGGKFTLRLIGNGEYTFHSATHEAPIVVGSMNDPVVPEIVTVR